METRWGCCGKDSPRSRYDYQVWISFQEGCTAKGSYSPSRSYSAFLKMHVMYVIPGIRSYDRILDLEETLVCPSSFPSRLLQNRSRVQAPPTPRSRRRPFMYPSPIETTRQRVWTHPPKEDVLPPGRISDRSTSMDRSYRRSETNAHGNIYTKLCQFKCHPNT